MNAMKTRDDDLGPNRGHFIEMPASARDTLCIFVGCFRAMTADRAENHVDLEK